MQSATGFGRSGERYGKYPFSDWGPGRCCRSRLRVLPVEPAEDPEALQVFDLPEGRAVFFIHNDLGDGGGKPSLARCIAPYFVR
jgi:hypothetical protein